MKHQNEIIYIGGNGKLARFLKNSYNVKSTSRIPNDPLYFDLNDTENLNLINRLESCTVVFGAAISSPEYCDDCFEECYKINYINTSKAIKLLLKKNKVIFLSSDLVYSGNNQEIALTEEIEPLPSGSYEKLKFKIEREFNTNPSFSVIRLSYVEFSDNSFFSYLNDCFLNNNTAKIIDPLIRHVTDPNQIFSTIEKYHNGSINYPVINLSGSKQSRIDLLKKWEKLTGNKLSFEIIPIEDSELKNKPKYLNFRSIYL